MNYERMWIALRKDIYNSIHDKKHKQREKTKPDFDLYRTYEKEITILQAILTLMICIEDKEKGDSNNGNAE